MQLHIDGMLLQSRNWFGHDFFRRGQKSILRRTSNFYHHRLDQVTCCTLWYMMTSDIKKEKNVLEPYGHQIGFNAMLSVTWSDSEHNAIEILGQLHEFL